VGGAAELATLFAVVFALNVVPAFAPPTWMALSWVGFTRPLGNPFGVALIGAVAATSGRLVLAKLSRVIIRQRFMSDTMRANIDVIKDGLERHRTLTFGAFLLYAFSPFPSNYLFIAYGLTSLPFWLVVVPFFIGRCVSYSLFVLTASKVSQRLALEVTEAQQYFGIYFVVSQFLLLGVVFLLARVDWRYLVAARRFRWLRHGDLGRP
jgi:membrane protein YqaA with SNARE-associated domain